MNRTNIITILKIIDALKKHTPGARRRYLAAVRNGKKGAPYGHLGGRPRKYASCDETKEN